MPLVAHPSSAREGEVAWDTDGMSAQAREKLTFG